MNFFYVKVMLMVTSWVVTKAVPVAMLPHATSSQSFVLHQPLTPQANSPSSGDHYGPSSTPAKYEYKYEVSDHETGDRKSHWETRDGDRVRGAYSLYEPDGALRTVEYSADALHGFNAVVRRDEPMKHQSRINHSPSQHSYGSSNSVSDRYRTPAKSRYIPERGSNDPPAREPKYSLNQDPAVGFTVKHGPVRPTEDYAERF